MTPKVSICIPAYLQTHYLRNTLDSISSQDFDDYEVIISDDSPGTTVEKLVNEYDFGDKLLYVRNPDSLGSPANWNRAVGLSRGEYIKILHHDDWLSTPSSLTQFVRMLDSNPNAGFAFSGATAQIAASRKTWTHSATGEQIDRLNEENTLLFNENFIGPPSATIVRRNAFIEYDENLVWLVDIAHYINMLRSTEFVATAKPLIVSISQAPHQITNRCVGDRCTNIFEYFYLFNTINDHVPLKSRPAYMKTLINLVLAHGVLSLEDIRRCGYRNAVPAEVLEFLEAPVMYRLMKRCQQRIANLFVALQTRLRAR